MNKALKAILCILLALCACFIVYKIIDGVMQPVRFNKEVEARKKVAVQRLKDIRELQVAFKGVNDRFTASFDTLKQFYKDAYRRLRAILPEEKVIVFHDGFRLGAWKDFFVR